MGSKLRSSESTAQFSHGRPNGTPNSSDSVVKAEAIENPAPALLPDSTRFRRRRRLTSENWGGPARTSAHFDHHLNGTGSFRLSEFARKQFVRAQASRA
jgi:hypothetical protein